MATKTREPKRARSRWPMFAGIGVIALLVVGFAAWWVLFRDDAPASVDSEAAAAARQEALADAAEDNAAEDNATEPDPAEAPAAVAAPTAEEAQPDAAASAGNPLDGIWTVDTSIGTFDELCLTEVCSSTFAGFRIKEELASIGAKTVVGRSPAVTGSIEIAGTQIVAGSFVVDMTQLITDTAGRNSAIRGRSGGLETNAFPEATFVLTAPIELGELPVEGASVEVEAVGDLTVHGVTNSVTIPLTAEQQAGVIVVFGNLEAMLLSDYDIPIPSAVVVVSVEDNATMELQLFFTR